MNYREAQERLRAMGILMSKRDGRIRLNYSGGSEETAYYTQDLEDAIDAGGRMGRSRQPMPNWFTVKPPQEFHRNLTKQRLAARWASADE
ncbi:hypothetical protein FHS67_001965 [Aminobacter aminovorans]|uniref:Membrane protein n=1 Tax=Aminobacter aminovorans TaxID=83263 RepID=A0AAC9ASY1_AMIAI|nr:membrane protein [Aminobacter aminovorans]MBB3705650.1 hypothetical protein [Aminobacter aminovorans]MDR7224653.1 hypothetical protein [Aminobacter aminovorans]